MHTANGRVHDLTARELGSVRIEPAGEIVVGSMGTWTLVYTVGRYGIDVGGGLRIGTRRMADWGIPQFDDPKADNYVTVGSSTPANFALRYEPRGHVRPFRAVIDVQLTSHALYPGDEVRVVLGDRSHGSLGMLAQSFPESECEIAAFVDCLSSGEYVRVPQLSPPLRVVAGSADGIEVQAPSIVTVDMPFRVQIRAVDRFGNPTAIDHGDLTLETDPSMTLRLDRADGRARWIDGARLLRPGVRRLALRSGDEVLALSNPIRVSETPSDHAVFWGDTQGQTASTVGAGSVAEYFAYARDLAGLDFVTHQANDFMMPDAAWNEIREETNAFDEPGRFTAILGYEWSGTTGAGGDRNVLFSGDDGPVYRSSFWQVAERRVEAERDSVAELHRSLRDHVRRTGEDVLLIPHVGGRRSDVDVHDPEFEHLIEICSCHAIFEWRLFEALARGQRIGVAGASDDHTCRPGLAFPSTPEMALRGGLTAVFAKDLDRKAILEALSARRCYGTTGQRILLHVEANGHPMGAAFATPLPHVIRIQASGTAPIDEITVFDRGRIVCRFEPNPPERDPARIRLTWTGARHQDRNRAINWDGGLELSQGRIIHASPLNMYQPKEGIVAASETTVRWRSVTASQVEGVLLEVDAPDTAELHFKAGPADFRFEIGEVRERDVARDFGGLGIGVAATTLHCSGDETEVALEVIDPQAASGEHAYHVRVVQRDFARAWSSPIYATIEEGKAR